ncbi:hypothetical protein MLD38_019712 [Melastoma candidum]|uniref:Uncharacterized protein n=1 Tax=Melastoma candidum TaxID=119954 RepID=A0ACB9QYZ0_9MYRT|nr:hypothetical protein MLD38_019712 [Melastoma candidum]
MNDEQRSLLLRSAARFPLPEGMRFSYGTAGFRADALVLHSTMFRAGIIASLRSLKNDGAVIGLMVTASHNQITDNGVKIADPSGGMLSQLWEPFTDAVANAPDADHLLRLICDFAEKEGISFDGSCRAEVLMGRDTRPSGESLLEAAKEGVNAIAGSAATDMGVLTAPQLHWMVRARNRGEKASEVHYFEQLAGSFRCLIDLAPNHGQKSTISKLVVDGANGVGAEKLELLIKMLDVSFIEVRNNGKGGGILNEGVGADYVQKERVVPDGFGGDDVGIRCASLDGDADRLVYFMIPSASGKDIILVDGDKMLSLFALFIKDQLSVLLQGDVKDNSFQPRLGVVQTAYANGASTDYLKRSGLEVIFTPTGVKYLHEKAAEYDIGIYFEANGHGTVLFSKCFLSWLEARSNELSSNSAGSDQQRAALRLMAVSKLINQAIGDALSGLLLVEAILFHMGWSISQWNELYHDLPSRQLKVKVKDRTAVVTTNAETTVVKPPGIQEAINVVSAKYPRGRSFIRPSGTEDVIRVYAEASTKDYADGLAKSIAELVESYLG